MTTKRTIKWEKWADPYGENIGDVEWPGAIGDFNTDEQIEKMYDDSDEDEWSEDDYGPGSMQDYQKLQLIHATKNRPLKMLATPMGVVPLTEYSTPSRIFNFWVAHSTFRMTEAIKDIIDNTDGVEILDIFTPYRWRIAVGKAFDEQETKMSIMYNLGCEQ